jgi:hypothetical protein
MSDELSGKKIVFLMANEGVEQVELVKEVHVDQALVSSRKPDDLRAAPEGPMQASGRERKERPCRPAE